LCSLHCSGGIVGLVLVVVPECLIVVLGHVVDDFLRIRCVSRGLAVVVDFGTGSHFSGGRLEPEIRKAAGNTHPNPVAHLQQAVLLFVTAAVAVVGEREQAVAEALVGPDGGTSIKRAATTRRI